MKTLLLLITLLATVSSQATVDIFMKFSRQGFDDHAFVGDSRDPHYPADEGWFEVDSYSLGIENTINIGSTSGGTGAGRADFKKLIIAKGAGVGSAHFFRICALGIHGKIATLVVRKPGGDPENNSPRIFQAEFHLNAVESVVTEGDKGDDEAAETVTLQYGAHRIEFFTTTKAGAESSAGVSMWSRVTNTESVNVSAP